MLHSRALVRVKIIKQPTGTVDAVHLWKLIEGHVYDVTPSMADFLVASRWAEAVVDEQLTLIGPVDHPSVVELLNKPERAIAADRRRRTRTAKTSR